MSIASLILLTVLAVLAVAAFGPSLARGLAGARHRLVEPRPRHAGGPLRHDPGRERRAERRARELMRSVVGPADYEMYERLGFLRVRGRGAYGYLVYPHRPIVSYDARTHEPLGEHCVEFPDRAETAYGEHLPDADDVLAKWMSLHGDEDGLIAGANMHAPGRQLDRAQLRRDLLRLRAWEQGGHRRPARSIPGRAGAEREATA